MKQAHFSRQFQGAHREHFNYPNGVGQFGYWSPAIGRGVSQVRTMWRRKFGRRTGENRGETGEDRGEQEEIE